MVYAVLDGNTSICHSYYTTGVTIGSISCSNSSMILAPTDFTPNCISHKTTGIIKSRDRAISGHFTTGNGCLISLTHQSTSVSSLSRNTNIG